MKRLLFSAIILASVVGGVFGGTRLVQTKQTKGLCSDYVSGDFDVNKPVLYIYGYNDKEIAVTLELDGEITSTYPTYNENTGWHVTAKTDGTLVSKDKKDKYPYLYWEGKLNDVTFNFNKGFCIKGDETGDKLNEILKSIGLNDTERADFITYWLPQMEKNEYNVVAFQTKPYTSKAKLDISPKPDSVTRVFMAWYGTDEYIKMDEQKFTKCPRKGMYAIEWGGCEVNSQSLTPLYNGDVAVEEGSEELSGEQAKINKYMELTLEENNAKQQEFLEEIRHLQSAAYYKMLGMSSVPSNVATQMVKPQNMHTFTDTQGNKASFTDEEWKRLQNIWSYTGHPDDLIKKHTVGELNQLLGKK